MATTGAQGPPSSAVTSPHGAVRATSATSPSPVAGARRGEQLCMPVGGGAEGAAEAARLRQQQYMTGNKVATSKYTALTFLPKFLWESYHHAANVYFTFDLGVQLIPGVTPVPPITTALPLMFVLGVSGTREALEDYARHKADSLTNSAPVQVLRGDEWQTVEAAQLEAGDVVRCVNGQEIPADLVLLSSSGEGGVCYDMTANLDGETNLKQRRVLEPTAACTTPRDLNELRGVRLVYELPNAHIHNFNGQLICPAADPATGKEIKYSVSAKNVLLRGSRLRNTEWVVGVVVYAGEQTRLSRNQRPPPSRMSTVERRLNQFVVLMFALQTLSVAVCATGSVLWSASSAGHQEAYAGALEFSSEFVLYWRNHGTFFILFALYIPISLFVTLELVRFGQALFMRWDILEPAEAIDGLDWGDPDTGSSGLIRLLFSTVGGIKPRTSSLNEDLGRIQHVFSDKTGTLTKNVMSFAAAAVPGYVFDEHASPGGIARARDDGACSEEDGERLRNFLRVMALCHTVVPEVVGGELVYQSESTDELALVEAAARNGIRLKSRTPHVVTVEHLQGTPPERLFAESPGFNALKGASGGAGGADATEHAEPKAAAEEGEAEEFELLATLEFSPERRRQSVVVRLSDGNVLLLTKGADSVMFKRVEDSEEQRHARAELNEHLEAWSQRGLRTLVMGGRLLSAEEFASWNETFEEARSAVHNREELVAAAAEKLEGGLKLFGATAIEDGLQDNVPSTIKFLLDAGMAVWVLTGDKQSTAVAIGYSCKLLQKEMTLVIVNSGQASVVRDRIEEALELPSGTTLGLVTDGDTLDVMLAHCEVDFLELVNRCRAVVVCRATPLQKARAVATVQRRMGKICLAVGDGANDVSMLQQAHVGVGVLGHEGTQAARASDYMISQFQHLARLTAVHGRYSYVRVVTLINYSFYKNLAFTIMPLWFAIDSGFTGQTLHDAWNIVVYNMLFTSLPPFIMGLLEKDIDETTIMANPQAYARIASGSDMSFRTVAVWIANGFCHSLIMYYTIRAAMGGSGGALLDGGCVGGLWAASVLSTTMCIFVVLLKAALVTRYMTMLNKFSIWLSLIVYLLFTVAYSASGMVPAVQSIVTEALLTPPALLSLLLGVASCFMLDLFVTAVAKEFYPEDVDILRERAAKLRKSATATGSRVTVVNVDDTVGVENHAEDKPVFTGTALPTSVSPSVKGTG